MFEGTTNSLESLKEFRFEKSMFMFSKYLHKDDSYLYEDLHENISISFKLLHNFIIIIRRFIEFSSRTKRDISEPKLSAAAFPQVYHNDMD